MANPVPESGTHLLAGLLTLLGLRQTDFGGIRSHLVPGPPSPFARSRRGDGQVRGRTEFIKRSYTASASAISFFRFGFSVSYPILCFILSLTAEGR